MYRNRFGLTGKGIGVAVLDTGISPHIDFGKRIFRFEDILYHRKEPYDDCGHGTHVAGLIGGSGYASGGRYCGVAPGCLLTGIKVLDYRGNGKKQDMLKGIQWVCDHASEYGIRILNISVGAAEPEQKLHDMLIESVEKAWDAGMVVVTAAGNMGPAPGSITAPGSSRKVITVGSSDMLVHHRGISGRGPTRECVCKPDLVAPGNEIISCAPIQMKRYYVKRSGTSMSTPLVSGAIALALEKDSSLTNVEIKMILKDSCRDLGYGHNLQGWGELNLDKFLSVI